MFAQAIVFFAVIFTSEAFGIEDIIANNPNLQKCVPTFSMFDASGKLPSGINSLNFIDLGNFDQCLAIDEENNKGKYCIVKIVPPSTQKNSTHFFRIFGNAFSVLPEPEEETHKIKERAILQGIDPTDNSTGLIVGWCIPHTCPIDELSIALTSVLQEIDPQMKITPVIGGMCQTKDDLEIKYDTSTIILITFLSITLFLMVISTIYDMYIQHHKKKPAHIILIAFSVKTNGQKLLSVSHNPDQLPCLNGIRLLSMMWVIYGHRFASNLMAPVMNLLTIENWLDNPANMYMLNAPVSVDSFFVLSGFLVAYGYCLAMDKGVKFNIILFYLHRYLRLTPVLAVLVWAHTTIVGYFGSGPFWPFAISALQGPCINYWWSSLLYAQNYYNAQETCIGQTWYLAIDMQLFILAPIILIPLWKWPKQTMSASAVLVLASMAICFGISYVQDLPSFTIELERSVDYNTYYYMPTHTRYGPWLMGLMLGYYIFTLKKNRNNRISLHPSIVVFGWLVALGLLLATLFAGHVLLFTQDKLGHSFFNGFHRHGWALGLCWVIFACTQGYGGPINTFLSWSLFQILGRFTYTMYLVHLTLQYLMTGSTRTSSYFTDFNTMHLFWGDFMMSLAISVCLTLAYESPMITMEKVLFKTGRKPQKPELPVHNENVIENDHVNKGFQRD